MTDASGSRTVLIVDTDEAAAAALETFMADANLATCRAIDGRGAIERIAATPTPALVVMEPAVEHGWAVLEWLASRESELARVPVLIVSSLRRSDAEPFARALGAVGWVEKPVNLARLLEVWDTLRHRLSPPTAIASP